MNGGATCDGPTQHARSLTHRPAGQRWIAQEPAVVDRYELRDASWRDHVVGAVNDIGPAQEAVDPRPVDDAPQTMGEHRRQREPAGTGWWSRSKRGDVLDQLEIFGAAQCLAHPGDCLADARTWAGERTDIESDAQWVHGHAEASCWQLMAGQSRRLSCSAFLADP